MDLTRRSDRSVVRRGALFGAGVMVVGGFTLVGCGSSHSTRPAAPGGQAVASPATAIEAARTTTTRVKSARLTLDEVISVGGRSRTAHGTGVTGIGTSGRADGEFTLTVAGQNVEMRVVGTTLYEKLPPAAARQLSDGKPWISVDTTKVARSTATMQNQAPNASQQLGYLRDPQKVTKAGTATIDGTPTTHYHFTVSPSRLGGGTATARTAGDIPVDVWIDGSHRVRQEKLTLTVRTNAGGSASASAAANGGSPGGSRSARVSMTMRLGDFGTPVHVDAPPRSQVTDATAKLKQAMDQGRSA